MHHHSKNESSLFSCLVLSSFVFSSPVFSLLFRLLSSPGPCLLSVSVCLCLCLCVCLRVLLRVGVRGLCGVCFVWCGVWRGLARRKKPLRA